MVRLPADNRPLSHVAPTVDYMTIRERMILTIAAATYTHPGRRDTDYHELVGHTPARAWQIVAALLQRPDAEAEMPAVVRRLRRLQEAREKARTGARA